MANLVGSSISFMSSYSDSDQKWIIDLGVDDHMTSIFRSINSPSSCLPITPHSIKLPKGDYASVTHIEHFSFHQICNCIMPFMLKYILWIPCHDVIWESQEQNIFCGENAIMSYQLKILFCSLDQELWCCSSTEPFMCFLIFLS